MMMAEQPPAAMTALPLVMASTTYDISQQEGAAPATTHPAPGDATTPSQNRMSFALTGKNTSPTLPSSAKFHVGVHLPSYLSMCVYKFLLSVLSKKPFLVKRKKSQQLGSPGSTTKEGRLYIFLSKM
jgi:hypothetical protein